MTDREPYDRKLGEITAQDREYAADLLHDIEPGLNHGKESIELVAEWFRKVRYEAVMAERLTHGENMKKER